MEHSGDAQPTEIRLLLKSLIHAIISFFHFDFDFENQIWMIFDPCNLVTPS